MKYAWIKIQTDHSVGMLCRTLGVSVSGFYAWRDRKPSERDKANAQLLGRIKAIHEEAREAYGTERIWRACVIWAKSVVAIVLAGFAKPMPS